MRLVGGLKQDCKSIVRVRTGGLWDVAAVGVVEGGAGWRRLG